MPCRPSPQGGIMVTASRVLSVEQSGHVAILWLDNPERRNALGPEFWEDLPALMRQLSDDSAVRAIVIAAKGPHFTVGLDLKAFGGTVGGGDGSSEAARRTRVRGGRPRRASCPARPPPARRARYRAPGRSCAPARGARSPRGSTTSPSGTPRSSSRTTSVRRWPRSRRNGRRASPAPEDHRFHADVIS